MNTSTNNGLNNAGQFSPGANQLPGSSHQNTDKKNIVAQDPQQAKKMLPTATSESIADDKTTVSKRKLDSRTLLSSDDQQCSAPKKAKNHLELVNELAPLVEKSNNYQEQHSFKSRIYECFKKIKKTGYIDTKNCCGNNMLHLACHSYNLELVKVLIKYGADIHGKNLAGMPPLHCACMSPANSGTAVVRYLIECGADVNTKNTYGDTPLHGASYYKGLDTINLLLEHKAKINVTNNVGAPPLHYIIYSNSEKIARCLLGHGANANVQDNNGCTYLHLISQKIGLKLINNAELAIDYGADITIRDKYGKFPLDYLSIDEIRQKLLIKFLTKEATKKYGLNNCQAYKLHKILKSEINIDIIFAKIKENQAIISMLETAGIISVAESGDISLSSNNPPINLTLASAIVVNNSVQNSGPKIAALPIPFMVREYVKQAYKQCLGGKT